MFATDKALSLLRVFACLLLLLLLLLLMLMLMLLVLLLRCAGHLA
jgi:hypothetical protein